MKIVILRSNPINPEPRVEKEAYALYKEFGNVEILCWDRSRDYSIAKEVTEINNIKITTYKVGIKGSFGGGIKDNFYPLLKLQFLNGYSYVGKRII